MVTDTENAYDLIRSGRAGFYEQKRGLIAVWGKEAVQFLDGLITNDMKTLGDGASMLAAFPNAQGRLLAVVRVQRQGDRFLFETEEATREKVFQNLFRFTFAGDFFVEDLSDQFSYFEIFGPKENVWNPNAGGEWPDAVAYELPHGAAYCVRSDQADKFREFLAVENQCIPIDSELYETLRIEAGIPKYGVDMDETTIVPELGLDGMISYNKGCYIGQEIIARIYFRGHVAKRFTGLALEGTPNGRDMELKTPDGKNGGRLTSVTYSPKLKSTVALGFVRYDHLAPGTVLKSGADNATVTDLPFV